VGFRRLLVGIALGSGWSLSQNVRTTRPIRTCTKRHTTPKARICNGRLEEHRNISRTWRCIHWLNTLNDEQPIRLTDENFAEVWKREEALERIGGDESLLQELCQIFLSGYPNLLEKLRDAVVLGDALALQHAAHSLKGELSYLSAPQATSLARLIEDMGRGGDLTSASSSLAKLEQSLSLLHLAIEKAAGVH
jgi:HPt (histidine-containing phosphotransfer) domain-containing protein